MVYFRRVFPAAVASVDMTHVARWPLGMPLSRIGSYRAMAEFKASLDDSCRIQFCGDYPGAIGQENAVEQGNRAADRMRRAVVGRS